MNDYQRAVHDARRLVRTHTNGLLSTLSVDMPGWPFGSVAPYVLDYGAQPILLLSDLAQHSHNVRKDNRASLLAWEHEKDDIQQAGRVTLLGRAAEIPIDEPLRERYLRYLPQAREYFAVHDFRFYRLSVERVRFIGGFGDIHWIRGEDYILDTDSYAVSLAAAETGAVSHMNADHREALIRYCHAHGIDDPEPRLMGIDPEGFDIMTRTGRVRVEFPSLVRDPSELRAAFVALSRSLVGGNDMPGAGIG